MNPNSNTILNTTGNTTGTIVIRVVPVTPPSPRLRTLSIKISPGFHDFRSKSLNENPSIYLVVSYPLRSALDQRILITLIL